MKYTLETSTETEARLLIQAKEMYFALKELDETFRGMKKLDTEIDAESIYGEFHEVLSFRGVSLDILP